MQRNWHLRPGLFLDRLKLILLRSTVLRVPVIACIKFFPTLPNQLYGFYREKRDNELAPTIEVPLSNKYCDSITADSNSFQMIRIDFLSSCEFWNCDLCELEDFNLGESTICLIGRQEVILLLRGARLVEIRGLLSGANSSTSFSAQLIHRNPYENTELCHRFAQCRGVSWLRKACGRVSHGVS